MCVTLTQKNTINNLSKFLLLTIPFVKLSYLRKIFIQKNSYPYLYDKDNCFIFPIQRNIFIFSPIPQSVRLFPQSNGYPHGPP